MDGWRREPSVKCGGPFVGRARVLPANEEPEAERALQANYGLGRRLYNVFGRQVDSVYVEVTPVTTS